MKPGSLEQYKWTDAKASKAQVQVPSGEVPLCYQMGFSNDLISEAVPGTVPTGISCIKVPAHGLYHEVVNATSFTAPRQHNLRAHFYRIRPSVVLPELKPRDGGLFKSAPLPGAPEVNAIRWRAFDVPSTPRDFIDGMVTLCANGSAAGQVGMAMHIYRANRSMGDKVFSNGDGEMLIIPQHGRIRIMTELGMLDVDQGELALVPRGMKMRVDLLDEQAGGWMCENYGLPFQLPELGLIGSHGQANRWDFEVPVAAYEDREVQTVVLHKLSGAFWEASLDRSPFDVVGWRGNWFPVKYDMTKFDVLGAVSFDHADPSIYCALTSPGDAVGGANVDFMIMPPRWLVSQRTFRPAAFHRNGVAEFLAVVYDRTGGGATKLGDGAATLHNNWVPHGPDPDLVRYGRTGPSEPAFFDRLFFMMESRLPFVLTEAGRGGPERDTGYLDEWKGLEVQFEPDR